MKEKLSALLLIAAIFCGCSNQQDDKITAIWRAQNEAWGHYDYGYFAESDGDVYSFGIDYPNYNTAVDGNTIFFDKMNIIKECTEPFYKISSSEMKKIEKYGNLIDENAEFDSHGAGCDMGQLTYFYNSTKNELLALYTDGDIVGKLNDDNAEALIEIYDKKSDEFKKSTNSPGSESTPYIFTPYDYCTFENFYTDTAIRGKYIIENEQELKKIEEMTGITFDNIIDANDITYWGYNMYIMIEDAESKPSLPYAFIYQNNRADFVYLPENIVSYTPEIKGSKNDAVCCIAVVNGSPRSYQGTTNELDMNGNAWLKPQ